MYTHILSMAALPCTYNHIEHTIEHLASSGSILWLDRTPLWPCFSFWNLPWSPDHTVRTGTRAQSTSCNLSASQATTQHDTFKWISTGQQVFCLQLTCIYHPYISLSLQHLATKGGWLVFVQKRSLATQSSSSFRHSVIFCKASTGSKGSTSSVPGMLEPSPSPLHWGKFPCWNLDVD